MGGAAEIISEPLTPLTVAEAVCPLASEAVMVVAPAAFTKIQMSASPVPSVATTHAVVLQGSSDTDEPGAVKVTDAPATGVTPPAARTRTRNGLGALPPSAIDSLTGTTLIERVIAWVSVTEPE